MRGSSGVVFADQRGLEAAAADRAGRLEFSGRQRRRVARRGRDRAMLGTAAEPFAIDHHRACEGEPHDIGARHRGKKFGRAGIVRGRIVGQVADIDAEADFCGQMNDGIAPSDCAIERVAVAHIGHNEVDSGRRRPCPSVAVNVRAQQIQDRDVMPAREQFAQDMLSDESRAAGQKHPHDQRLVMAIWIVASAAMSCPPDSFQVGALSKSSGSISSALICRPRIATVSIGTATRRLVQVSQRP